MPTLHRWTLTRYLIEERRRFPEASGDLNALLLDLALACKAVARIVSFGALEGLGGAAMPAGGGDAEATAAAAAAAFAQMRRAPEDLAHEAFVQTNAWGGHLAGMAGAAGPLPAALQQIPPAYPRGKYLLLFDALDSARHIDVNQPVGSLFAILRAPASAVAPARDVAEADFLQPGRALVAAGYALYGPSTALVLSVGNGVAGFTLDHDLGEFLLTQPAMRVPQETAELALAGPGRDWEPPVRRYVQECAAGRQGPRGRDFELRGAGSLVAEAHRVLVRGGVVLAPRELRDGAAPGPLRLLFEANPLAMLMEQAGGRASTGRQPVLGVPPTALGQRLGLVFGSRAEVERLERYHREPAAADPGTPLFGERSLFRD
jgi:fructose-1,6-bisphosphatase I/sedoheptulose-1,7-bisphosphatase